MQQITDQLEASIIFEKHQNNLDIASDCLNDAKVYYRSWLNVRVRIKNYNKDILTLNELRGIENTLYSQWHLAFEQYRTKLHENLSMTLNDNSNKL